MRSSSPTERAVLASVLALVLAACARSAPDLPPQSDPSAIRLSAGEAAMSCTDIASAIDARRAERETLTAEIHGNRQRNQAAGYLGALFIVPLVAAKNNTDEKTRLDEIQTELDRLYAVNRARRC